MVLEWLIIRDSTTDHAGTHTKAEYLQEYDADTAVAMALL